MTVTESGKVKYVARMRELSIRDEEPKVLEAQTQVGVWQWLLRNHLAEPRLAGFGVSILSVSLWLDLGLKILAVVIERNVVFPSRRIQGGNAC
jgi:hypothetical protein